MQVKIYSFVPIWAMTTHDVGRLVDKFLAKKEKKKGGGGQLGTGQFHCLKEHCSFD